MRLYSNTIHQDHQGEHTLPYSWIQTVPMMTHHRRLTPWNRTPSGPYMDWREEPDKVLRDRHQLQTFISPLENGHTLVVWGKRFRREGDGWLAHITTHTTAHPVIPQIPYMTINPHHFPTPEHAMNATEQAYRKLFPLP